MRLFILITPILFSIVGCKTSQTLNKAELKEEKLNNQLSISIPQNYKDQGYWVGEDTKGFKKVREDGKVSFICEYGKGVETETIQSPSLKEVPKTLKNYKAGKITKLANKSKAIFYTTNTTAKVRDTEGILLIQEESGATVEILRVSYKAEEQDEVMAIIKTIK